MKRSGDDASTTEGQRGDSCNFYCGLAIPPVRSARRAIQTSRSAPRNALEICGESASASSRRRRGTEVAPRRLHSLAISAVCRSANCAVPRSTESNDDHDPETLSRVEPRLPVFVGHRLHATADHRQRQPQHRLEPRRGLGRNPSADDDLPDAQPSGNGGNDPDRSWNVLFVRRVKPSRNFALNRLPALVPASRSDGLPSPQ